MGITFTGGFYWILSFLRVLEKEKKEVD